MLFYNGKPHCVFSQLLFYCQVYVRKTIFFVCLFCQCTCVKTTNKIMSRLLPCPCDTSPIYMKNKPVILRHLVDMWFIHLRLHPRWVYHISPRCLKITLTYLALGQPTDRFCTLSRYMYRGSLNPPICSRLVSNWWKCRFWASKKVQLWFLERQ